MGIIFRICKEFLQWNKKKKKNNSTKKMGKYWDRHFTKEGIWTANRYTKRRARPLVVREVEAQSAHPREDGSGRQRTSTGGHVGKLESSCFAGEDVKRSSHLESNLLVSSKSKHTGTAQPGSPPPRGTPRGTKTQALTKTRTRVLALLIKTRGLIPVSINRWMNKQNILHPHNGIIFGNTKE